MLSFVGVAFFACLSSVQNRQTENAFSLLMLMCIMLCILRCTVLNLMLFYIYFLIKYLF